MIGRTQRLTVAASALLANVALAQSDGFETYIAGTQLHHINGWAGWDDSQPQAALVSTAHARDGSRCVDIVGTPSSANCIDQVRTYSQTSGQWRFTAWQYIPTGATGGTYLILMNMYAPGGVKYWSTQVYFDLNSNHVYDNLPWGSTGYSVPLVRDQWVLVEVDIDLDLNTQKIYYGGQLILNGAWTRMGGPREIAAVDLYAYTAAHVYYDDVALTTAHPKLRVTTWREAEAH